jgi:hypothetical protein
MTKIYQSKDQCYVVVRSRDPEACITRLGAFKVGAVGEPLAAAIEKYGADYQVVVEPVEFESPPMPPPPEEGTDEWYRQKARSNYEDGGVIEIDREAAPSHGDAGGAYVQAWIWVECDMENKSDD